MSLFACTSQYAFTGTQQHPENVMLMFTSTNAAMKSSSLLHQPLILHFRHAMEFTLHTRMDQFLSGPEYGCSNAEDVIVRVQANIRLSRMPCTAPIPHSCTPELPKSIHNSSGIEEDQEYINSSQCPHLCFLYT